LHAECPEETAFSRAQGGKWTYKHMKGALKDGPVVNGEKFVRVLDVIDLVRTSAWPSRSNLLLALLHIAHINVATDLDFVMVLVLTAPPTRMAPLGMMCRTGLQHLA